MAKGDGTARFHAFLRALPADMRRAVDAELDRQALELVKVQRAAVPVRKGKLRQSIRAEPTPGRELSVTIKAGGKLTTKPVRRGHKATYDYALGQEFGNRRTRAQPYFFPSYRLKKPAIRRGITTAVRKTVTAATRR